MSIYDLPERFGKSFFIYYYIFPLWIVYILLLILRIIILIHTVEKWPCIAAHSLVKTLKRDINSPHYQPLWAKLNTIDELKQCFIYTITSKGLGWLKDWIHIYFNIKNIVFWENNELIQDKLHIEFCKVMSDIIYNLDSWWIKFNFDTSQDRFSVSVDNIKKDLFLLIFSSFSNWNWRRLNIENWELYWCLVVQPYDVFDQFKIIDEDWNYSDKKSLTSLRNKIRIHPNNWTLKKCPYHKLLKLFWIDKESVSHYEQKIMSNYPMQMPLPWELSESSIPNHGINWEQYAYLIKPWMSEEELNLILKTWIIKSSLSEVYDYNHIEDSIQNLCI